MKHHINSSLRLCGRRHISSSLRLVALFCCSAIVPPTLAAQQTATAQQSSTDPFIWLEEIDAKRSMDWVNAKNAATVAELGSTPLYQALYDRTKKILDSQDRIPYARIL